MKTVAPSPNLLTDLMDFMRKQGYGPGDRLPPIRELSTTLGFGRNAIRDGLLEAQTKGYVKIEPRLGVFVQDLDPASRANGLTQALTQAEQNLFHLVDARLLVEAELASQAALARRPEDLLPLRQALETVLACRGNRLDYIKADEEFHLAIARIAGNGVLFFFLDALWRMLRPAKLNLLLSTGSRKLADQEHRELFQSIVAGDARRARETMRSHIGRGRTLLLEYVRTLPSTKSEPRQTKR